MSETFERNHPEIDESVISESLDNTMEIVDKCNVTVEIDRKKAILPSVEIPEGVKGENEYLIKLCKDGWRWREIAQEITTL